VRSSFLMLLLLSSRYPGVGLGCDYYAGAGVVVVHVVAAEQETHAPRYSADPDEHVNESDQLMIQYLSENSDASGYWDRIWQRMRQMSDCRSGQPLSSSRPCPGSGSGRFSSCSVFLLINRWTLYSYVWVNFLSSGSADQSLESAQD
jgi:hypothetical protein